MGLGRDMRREIAPARAPLPKTSARPVIVLASAEPALPHWSRGRRMILMMPPMATGIGKIRDLSVASEQKPRQEGRPAQLHDKSFSHGMNIARLCGIARIGNPAC
jgi:hypothetical protein